MRKTIQWCGAVLISSIALLSASAGADSGRLTVVAGSADLSRKIVAVAVDSDASEPDAATVTIDADGAKLPKIGEALEVHASHQGTDEVIFKGEILGIEPAFETPKKSAVTIRAFNRLHRLTRGRKSRTFENQSDADIASRIAADNGLAFGPSGSEAFVKYDHVYQQNQTDLEFIGVRAARIGYEVVVDDSTLFFRRRREPQSTGLGCVAPAPGLSALLRAFHPRLSSANQVTTVVVRGYDPEHQREIVGTAHAPAIGLSPQGLKVDPPDAAVDLGTVPALATESSAYGAALGTLTALTAGHVSAEADSDGDASLRAGGRVAIDGVNAAFDGDYHIVAASHRFEPASRPGWHTLLRVVRDDRGRFWLPEVGDEVIVDFLEGDPDQPIIVGSFWDKDQPPETSPCDSGRHPWHRR